MREHSGSALAVVGTSLAFFLFLAPVLAALVFLFLMVTMIVQAVASGAPPSAGTVLLGVVLIVGVLATLFAASISLIGRSMNPRRRRR